MRNTIIILALCLLAIVAGAYFFLKSPADLTGATDQSAQVATAPVTEVPVAFTEIEKGSTAQGVTERKNVAARDAASYARLWQMVHGSDKIAPPSVDFSKEYVIGVFAGEKPTGGHMIEVQNVTELGDTRTISVTLTAPGASCITTQAITSPYQLIRVPAGMHLHVAKDTTTESACE